MKKTALKALVVLSVIAAGAGFLSMVPIRYAVEYPGWVALGSGAYIIGVCFALSSWRQYRRQP